MEIMASYRSIKHENAKGTKEKLVSATARAAATTTAATAAAATDAAAGGNGREFPVGLFAAAVGAGDFLIAGVHGGHMVEIGLAAFTVILVDGHRKGLQRKTAL
jgi:hypothetical protein